MEKMNNGIFLTVEDAEGLLKVIDDMWGALEDKSRFCCGFFNPVHEFREVFKEALYESIGNG